MGRALRIMGRALSICVDPALAHTLIALAHTLIALTHLNSTENLHRLLSATLHLWMTWCVFHLYFSFRRLHLYRNSFCERISKKFFCKTLNPQDVLAQWTQDISSMQVIFRLQTRMMIAHCYATCILRPTDLRLLGFNFLQTWHFTVRVNGDKI